MRNALFAEDDGGGTGYFTLNGVAQPDGQWIYPNPGDNVQYVGCSTPGTDTLEVGIYDYTTNSYSYAPTTIAAATTAPSSTVQFGIDYRDQAGALAHFSPADIISFQGGKQFAVEYTGITDGVGYLRSSDASALVSKGLSIVSVYEKAGMSDTDSVGHYTSGWVDYFSQPGQGTTDAQSAINAANLDGQLTGAIYFAVDLDPSKSLDPSTGQNRVSETKALDLIDTYFKDASAYINSYNQLHGTSYEIGVYGAGDTLSKIVNDPSVLVDGKPAYTLLAAPSTWPGFATFTTWNIEQMIMPYIRLTAVDLDRTSGQPFGSWGSTPQSAISAAAIQDDYNAIVRTSLSVDQATSVANSIDSGAQTEFQYINTLLSQVANTTIPAVAVEASMYGAVGTSGEVTMLATQFLPPQVANALKYGFNPQVYATEALGLVFAFNDENGSSAFAGNFGPSHAGMSNSAAGDAAFAAAASTAIFGSASTTTLVNAIQTYVSNWKAFYSSYGIPGKGLCTCFR